MKSFNNEAIKAIIKKRLERRVSLSQRYNHENSKPSTESFLFANPAWFENEILKCHTDLMWLKNRLSNN